MKFQIYPMKRHKFRNEMSKSRVFRIKIVHRKYSTQILKTEKNTHTKKTQIQTARKMQTHAPNSWMDLLTVLRCSCCCALRLNYSTLSSDTKPLTRLHKHTQTHNHNPRSQRGASYFRYLRFERIHQTDGSRWWLAIYQISSERCRAGEQQGNAHKRRFASCTYKACARACYRGRSSVSVVMVARSCARSLVHGQVMVGIIVNYIHTHTKTPAVCVCPVLCVYVFVQFITTVFGRHKTRRQRRRRQIDAGHALKLKTCSILHLIGHFHHQTGT